MKYLILRMWARGKSLDSSSCEFLSIVLRLSIPSIRHSYCEVLRKAYWDMTDV